MKHILTCSFGKDSIATALLALQHGEPLDELVYSEVMFSDTVSGELPEHKRFIYETAIPYFEKRGIPTRVLRGQKTYLDCFYHIVSRGNAEGKLASFPLTGRCSIQRDCKPRKNLPIMCRPAKRGRCTIQAFQLSTATSCSRFPPATTLPITADCL